MFHSLSSLQPSTVKRKKATSYAIPMALIHASPIRVENPYKPAKEIVNSPLIKIEEDNARAECHLNLFGNQDRDQENEASSQNGIAKAVDEDSSKTSAFHPNYPDEKVFRAALELFNKRNEVCHQNNSSSNSLQKWECKGNVRASFQLCVVCKDVGKLRAGMERYYLDVLEVSMYRTILCKRCLGFILYKHVGNCLTEIKELLNQENITL